MFNLKDALGDSIQAYKKFHNNDEPPYLSEAVKFFTELKPLLESTPYNVNISLHNENCAIHMNKSNIKINIYCDYGYDTILIFKSIDTSIICKEIDWNDHLLDSITKQLEL